MALAIAEFGVDMNLQAILVGVNHAPGSMPLNFAESDAISVDLLLRSGIGPVGDRQRALLLGSRATVQSVVNALVQAANESPSYFYFYAAGHGSSLGIHLSDGVLPFSTLREAIQLIGAESSIVILDVCKAGTFLQHFDESRRGLAGLDDDWVTLLANATPGTRVLAATRPHQNAFEDEVSGGVFTQTLLSVLRTIDGDLPGTSGRLWISDQLAFRETLRRMSRLGADQAPVGRKLGKFPLALGQAVAVGSAFIKYRVRGARLEVDCHVEGRRFMPTLLSSSVTNVDGHELASGRLLVLPPFNSTLAKRSFPCPAAEIASDPASRRAMRLYGEAGLLWYVALSDERGRSLAHAVVPASYGSVAALVH